MTELPFQLSSIAHVIQLAVAPVFLLAGVGTLLAVLTNRLARIVDRFHALEKGLAEESPSPAGTANLRNALTLSRRARLIHWSIILCTTCDLLVCMVVAALFVGAELHIDLSRAIALLFVAAMLALIGGLACFLREISLATGVIENISRSASQIDAAR